MSRITEINIVVDTGDKKAPKEKVQMLMCAENHDPILWRKDENRWCPACSALEDLEYEHGKKIEEYDEEIDDLKEKLEEDKFCDKCKALIDLRK